VSYLLCQADALRIPLADQSVDLICGSPPYCDARTYGIGAQRGCREWVDWMMAVTTEALRVSRGAVIWIAAGVTRDRTYWPACEGLMWEWWKSGGSCYRPCYWHRVGIPGSGGDQWFRSDVEYAMCFKRPGPLPWTDNTACGHPPKWAPGGEMSHRVSDGTRRNQWGGNDKQTERGVDGQLKKRSVKPSHVITSRKERGAIRAQAVADGIGTKIVARDSSVWVDDDERNEWNYVPPVIANPGNLLKFTVGGGQMGHALAHENEAPYPEEVPEFFIKSLCPPDGIVLDCFSGSGTTTVAAERNNRTGLGMDIRQSQAVIARQRISHPHAPVQRPGKPEHHPLLEGLH
jgi:DNA methylase